MAFRKVVIRQSAAENIAAISSFIESKGMLATAEKFADDIYNYFIRLSENKRSYPFLPGAIKSAARL